MMLTVAPGIGPFASVTIPLTLAVVTPWADTFFVMKNVMPESKIKSKNFLIVVSLILNSVN
jgi:hypothetical protein